VREGALRTSPICIAFTLATALIAPIAAEAGPAAMVEDVTGNVPGIQALDYLATGKVIRLAASARLVLDYLHSCVQERIAAGVVTIGSDQSIVQNGNVTRVTVSCDGGQLQLSPAQAEASAVIVFRGTTSSSGKKLPGPQFTLYGSSPLIELPGGGVLTIERLDRSEAKIVLDLRPSDLIRGRFYDCATAICALTSGGLYRATAGASSIVFAVSESAQPGEAPPITRLLRL